MDTFEITAPPSDKSAIFTFTEFPRRKSDTYMRAPGEEVLVVSVLERTVRQRNAALPSGSGGTNRSEHE